MDKYIKFPLPINKETINWETAYMKKGGKQLIEILEKEIPIELIEKNKLYWKITNRQIEKLHCWIKNNTVVERVRREMGLYDTSGAKNFFYEGKGILGKIIDKCNFEPVILPSGEIESRFSFINFESFMKDDVKVVFTKFNDNFYKKPDVNDYKLVKKYYFFKKRKTEWVQTYLLEHEVRELEVEFFK